METFVDQLKRDIKRYPARHVTTNTLLAPTQLPNTFGGTRSYVENNQRHWLLANNEQAHQFVLDYEEFLA